MADQAFNLSYWEKQKTRLLSTLKNLGSVQDPIQSGRVIPDEQAISFGLGRRLKMAILFLDISGFSALPSESLNEQEVLLRVLNLFFSEIVKTAEDFGGTVEKNTGDGLMAYFEDTSAGSSLGSERAISAALTMFYVTANLINPILLKNNLLPLRFRIGIDYGWVTIAKLGAAKRFNSIVAIGTTANIACKMLAHADPEELIIGENVVASLPEQRRHWCKIKTVNSGWIYRKLNRPYPFYTYSGRWINVE